MNNAYWLVRVFFKVLSSRSFFKGKQLWVSKSNMADKTSYCSHFPCHHSKICQKDSPHQSIFKLTLSQKSFYVFRKDRQCQFIEPKFRPDKHHLCLGFWSNESSRRNFAGCWLLSTILLVHCQFTPEHDNTHLLIQDCFHMYRQRKVYLPIKVIPCFERRSGSFGFSEAWPHPAQTAWKINKTLQSHFRGGGNGISCCFWFIFQAFVCLSLKLGSSTSQ